MRIKTLFIAPYRGLKELAKVLAHQQTDLDILVEEADLSAAIPIVKANENKGIQFIVSRGGTAKVISQYTDIPVIEIKLSGYDILRTLILIKDYQMKVHMIGFPNICNDVLSVSNLLNIDISYTIVDHKEEVENAVKEAWDDGAQLILGDTITVNTAESFGLQGMLITTGKEAVLEVFDQVMQMNQVMKQLENDYSLYKDFLDCMKDGIVIFQESGEIAYANQQFIQKLFKKNTAIDQLSIFTLPEEFLQLISELLPKTSTHHTIRRTIVVNGETLDVTAGRLDHEKIDFYYLKIHEKNLEVKKDIEVHNGRIPRTSFAQIVTSSDIMKNVLSEARLASEEKAPFIIWGNKGVGKRFLASSIHSESEGRDGQFMELIILNNSKKVMNEIASFLPAFEKTTVYVTGFEKLSIEYQREVIEVLNNKEQIKVIYSFHFDPSKRLDWEIINQMNEKSIYMPSLQERIEDIAELIRLFVSIFNVQFGKQVVGIKDEALSYLREYEWPENVKQLKNVVKEAVSTSEGDYIEKEEIDSLFIGESAGRKGDLIDLTKTLAEIEKEVILTVLKEENMNQTKAAKRLGINRTTLWRKIN